jgi:ABC-type multidrug transport system fused ATPase/permease subunit
MATAPNPDVPMDACRALITHLRLNPEDAQLPATVLADRFGLDASLVGSALSVAVVETPAESHRPHVDFSPLRRLARATKDAFDRLIERLNLFTLVTWVCCIGMCFLATAVTERLTPGLRVIQLRQGSTKISVDNAAISAFIAATFLLQFLAYFRRGMARYALSGMFIFWVVTSIPLMYQVWIAEHGKADASRAVQVGLVAFAMFFVSNVYGAMMAVASLFGAWFRMRRRSMPPLMRP